MAVNYTQDDDPDTVTLGWLHSVHVNTRHEYEDFEKQCEGLYLRDKCALSLGRDGHGRYYVVARVFFPEQRRLDMPLSHASVAKLLLWL